MAEPELTGGPDNTASAVPGKENVAEMPEASTAQTIKETLQRFADLESYLPDGIRKFIAGSEFFKPLYDDKKNCEGVILTYCNYVGALKHHFLFTKKCPTEKCGGALHELVQIGLLFMKEITYARRTIHDHILKCEKCDYKTPMTTDSCECSAARAR